MQPQPPAPTNQPNVSPESYTAIISQIAEQLKSRKGLILKRTRELRILDERFRIPRSTAVGLGCGFAQCFESEECGLTAENFRFVSANLLFDSSDSELVALTVDEGK